MYIGLCMVVLLHTGPGLTTFELLYFALHVAVPTTLVLFQFRSNMHACWAGNDGASQRKEIGYGYIKLLELL